MATSPIVTNARTKLLVAQERLDARRRADRRWLVGQCVSALALVVMFSGTAATWHASRFAVGDIACGSILLITLSVVAYDFTVRRDLLSRRKLEADVSARQEDVHAAEDGDHPTVEQCRRSTQSMTLLVLNNNPCDFG